ncbi:glycosyltransferase family 2 protein [Butyrivibrio sp. TB]|uniref:glycosyltransferase family 2 protein n=1 Tax=Butyrivibrio sp. TB TaxID=1520809 RepID=UPI0008D7D7E5|nr:glycosyltransferase [Butyrivibrio sp. TB]SEP96074.1 Glycosyltransferase involved in cell wall bisynthesis [Butyrivibrio sp. TB]
MRIIEKYTPGIIPEADQTDKISISVAVYNGEKYLNKCVDSLLAQTYKNIEVILVDDGSTDSCPAICDEYAQKDPRVKVVHKKNGGLASGRNAGIAAATGSYLGFMDGDDWVDPDMYMRLMAAIREHKADVAITRYRWVYEDRTEDPSTDKAYIMEDQEALEQYIHENDDIQIQNCAWNKLYSKEFLGDLRFDESKWYEDVIFTTKLISKASKVVFLDHASHNYICDRSGSYMNQGISERIITDLIPIYKERTAYLRSIGRDDLADTHNYYFYKRLMIYYTQAYRGPDQRDIKRSKMNRIKAAIYSEKDHFNAAFSSNGANPNEKKKMDIFLFSPRIYLIVMAINDRFIIPYKVRRLRGHV